MQIIKKQDQKIHQNGDENRKLNTHTKKEKMKLKSKQLKGIDRGQTEEKRP